MSTAPISATSGRNPADLADSLARFTRYFQRVKQAGVMPLTAGGDHLCSLPILRALAADAPVGLILFDSHTDLFHSYFGGTLYTHGNAIPDAPRRRG